MRICYNKTMKKVFIVHGFGGIPNGGWRPWLMGELAKKDIYASALPMPNPEAPKKEEWIKTIVDAVKQPNEEIFLVGHSLGVPAILRYLETLSVGQKIGGAVLVSGPLFIIQKNGYECVNKFLENSFDFEHLKNVCNNFVVVHGSDDQMVSFNDAEQISKNLTCELVSVPEGKHLNVSAGFYEVPQILSSLEKIIF